MTNPPATTKLSRRNLMATSGAIMTIAVAGAAVASAGPIATPVDADAELVELCAQRRKFCRAHDHAGDRAMDIEGVNKAHHDLLQSIATRIYKHRMKPLAKAIADRHAISWAGVTAKASVLASDQAFFITGETNDFFFCLEPLVLSVVKDIVRLGGIPMLQSSSSPQWEA